MRKKTIGLRIVLLCLTMIVAFVSLVAGIGLTKRRIYSEPNLELKSGSAADPNDPDFITYWVDLAVNQYQNIDDDEQIIHIQSEGELALLNKEISEGTKDYSEWTVILDKNLKMSDVYTNQKDSAGNDIKVTPIWTPIKVGTNGKNVNIIFDGGSDDEGNPHEITDLKIDLTDDLFAADSGRGWLEIGFFGNMVGGEIRNVVFKNPTIKYDYATYSLASDDVNRPTAPVEICMGTLVGYADSTYVHDVEIINPEIELKTSNINGHNFYMGGAVGKLRYVASHCSGVDEEGNSMWGVDSINISNGKLDMRIRANNQYKVNKLTAETNLLTTLKTKVPAGDELNLDEKTLLLEAVNNSELSAANKKAIIDAYTLPNGSALTDPQKAAAIEALDSQIANNTTLKNQLSTTDRYGIATIGYLGGLVGGNISSKIINCKIKGTTINPDFDAAIKRTIHDLDNGTSYVANYYTGGIAGMSSLHVHSGPEITATGAFNNIVMADVTENEAAVSGLFIGEIISCWLNNNLYLGTNIIKNAVGVAWNETLAYAAYDRCVGYENRNAIDEYYRRVSSTCPKTNAILFKGVLVCNTSVLGESANHTGFSSSGSISFNTISEMNSLNARQTIFTAADVDTFSAFDRTGDNLYDAVDNIVKFEYDEDNARNRRKAVDQFRAWVNESGEPNFTYRLGKNYQVIYHANTEGDENSGWLETGSNNKYNTEYVDLKKYNQKLYPEDKVGDPEYKYPIPSPVRPGYTFLGWYANLDLSGFSFNFRDVVMGTETIEFYAKWQINDVKVTYYLDKECTTKYYEEISWFRGRLLGPKNDPNPENFVNDKRFFGKSFIGWFLPDNIPASGTPNSSNRWIFGTENYTPALSEDFALCAGWRDNYSVLYETINSSSMVNNYYNYRNFYTSSTFEPFRRAYESGLNIVNNNPGTDPIRVKQVNDAIISTAAALRVDPNKMKTLPAFNENLDENKYPFLYTYDSYSAYLTVKEYVTNYIEVDLKDDEIAANVVRFKENWDNLTAKFNSLKNNPKMGTDQSAITEVKNAYTRIAAMLDDYVEEDCVHETWTPYAKALSTYQAVFYNYVSDPSIIDLQYAIDNYLEAYNQVQIKSKNTDDGDGNSAPQLSIPPVLLGFLILFAIAALTGGAIGFDIYYSTRIRPQKLNSTKAEQKANEDTYI